MRRVSLPLTACLLLALAVPAAADLAWSPVRARLERPSRLPAPAEEFTAALVIETARDARLSGIALAGDGWTVTRWAGASELPLAAGGSVRWELAAVPRAGFGPLVLTGEVNGRPWRRTFDVSREGYGGLLPVDSDRLPPRRILPAGGEKLGAEPRLSLAELSQPAADEAPPLPPADKRAGTCTVTGHLVYWHATQNRWLSAFGAHVWAWVTLPTGFFYATQGVNVDTSGTFALEVPDNADVRVGFSATSNAVVVQEDGVLEDDYVWSTAAAHIPAGTTQFDVGAIYPNSHHGALHICADLTHAHNYFRDLGWDVTRVDVQWPDDDEGNSQYDPFWDELHIERDAAWKDGTLCHEWGHYWHEMHAHSVTVDYCNGVCDDGDDCGHCGWCPENSAVTWIEGCAQIISRLCTDHIAGLVPFQVEHKQIATPEDWSSCDWIPWDIENVFAGAVYDMADDDRGVEANNLATDLFGHVLYDQLDLDPVDILNIMASDCDVEGHEPYRAPGFFRCAAEYLDQLGSPQATRAMLWETAQNWDLQIDDHPPDDIHGVTSTYPTSTPTSVAIGGFSWPAPADDLAGVCGYSVSIEANAIGMPDHFVDAKQPWYWPDGGLAPGTWWFSVIAVDRAGNWSGTPGYYGPIVITAAGPADLAPETPAGWTAPLVLRSTPAPAAPDPVTQPVNLQAHTVYFNWGERNAGTGPTATFRDGMYLDGSLVYTSNARSLGAGNSAQSRDQGPVDLGVIGRHTAWAQLDRQDTTHEADEGNNRYAKQFVFSPLDLSLGVTVARTGGLPEANLGQAYLPAGTPFYPNGDGFDIELCMFPELVWAVPYDPDDRIVARLHARDVGQTGFATALAVAASRPDCPAAVVQNTYTTLMTSYCIGVSDEEGSGAVYRIQRELGQFFALPDTLGGTLSADNPLDLYLTYNDTGAPAWFTLKLANPSARPLTLRLFEPGFGAGSLDDADLTLAVAAGDTVFHSVRLAVSDMLLAVVTRDPRLAGGSVYSIFSYVAKPDLEAATPDGWFANVVPQVGTPYAASGSVPAPAALIGDADTTGIYWSLRNASPEAGVPVGLQRRLDLDGAFLAGSLFVDPLAPGQEIKVAYGGRLNVRGGRHALTHRINYARTVDEDDYADDTHGRQWVWSPRLLATNAYHALPAPPSPYGGLWLVDEGLVAPNCDGYRFTTSVPTRTSTLFAAYAVAPDGDVDIGLYGGADPQDGFTTALAQSVWSGPGCDFVLRFITGPAFISHNLGAVRVSGVDGSFTLRAGADASAWSLPVGGSRSGTVEAGTYLDTAVLVLPPGVFRFTLQSDAVPLGFSLHDLSAGFGAKTSPWEDGIAWQEPGEAGQDVAFVIRVPDPAPARFGLVVWSPDGSTRSQAAPWTVAISADLTDVGGGEPVPPPVTASRLVSATPNPFNPATDIVFETAADGRCELTVHDLRGRLVRTLLAGDRPAGRHGARWDGLSDAGQRVPSGLYVARLRAARGETDLLKLTLVK